MSLISVIVPNFNSGEKLARLVSSIPDTEEIELIIVDDCSDLVPEFFNRNNVTVYTMPKNSGAGACRNVGLTYAKGVWLLFADSDDYFVDNWFDKCLSEIYQASSSVDIIFFSPSGDDNRAEPYKNLITRFKYGNSDSIRYGFYVPWSKLIRHEMVKKNAITFQETRVSNDMMFSTLIGHYADSITIGSGTIYYVSRSYCGLTGVKSKERTEQRIRVIFDVNEFLSSVYKKNEQVSFFRLIVNYYSFISLKEVINIFRLYTKRRWKLLGL